MTERGVNRIDTYTVGGDGRISTLNTIATLTINADGSLTALPSLTGTPVGLVGLAEY